mmetsp:Transcript_62890/g.149901  ORF Transcript_62890/g.149901 Transcript_62890/m.149901 type:complete len:214 (-) Transcript_62890:1273-1914(-)
MIEICATPMYSPSVLPVARRRVLDDSSPESSERWAARGFFSSAVLSGRDLPGCIAAAVMSESEFCVSFRDRAAVDDSSSDPVPPGDFEVRSPSAERLRPEALSSSSEGEPIIPGEATVCSCRAAAAAAAAALMDGSGPVSSSSTTGMTAWGGLESGEKTGGEERRCLDDTAGCIIISEAVRRSSFSSTIVVVSSAIWRLRLQNFFRSRRAHST